MNDPIRIAISGKMGAGKTTLANALSKRYDVPVLSFASGFKRLVEAAGVTKEGQPELYRRLCQQIGGGLRAIDRDIWVKSWFRAFERDAVERGIPLPRAGFIVDDLRYPNELEYLRFEKGAFTVRLEVPEAVRAQRRTIIDHESETALDEYVSLDHFDAIVYAPDDPNGLVPTPEETLAHVVEAYERWRERE